MVAEELETGTWVCSTSLPGVAVCRQIWDPFLTGARWHSLWD